MTIHAYIQGKELEPIGIEGSVEVSGSTLTASATQKLTELIGSFPDMPVALSKEPGGFSIIIRDETKPGGFVLADTAVIYPPIKLKPAE